jgi:hypothetical protein
MQSLAAYFLLALIVIFLMAAALYSQCSSIKLTRQNWKNLVSKLHKLNFDGVVVVARDFLEPHRGQLTLQPEQMWKLVGGYEGLKKMRENAATMLALAAYTQQWNFDEGVIVGERMRRDAVQLRHAVQRVVLRRAIVSWLPRKFRYTAPFDVHQAASSYYLMRQRLLALYETSHVGLYPDLAAVL